jgi:hypothetical protein
LFMVTSDVLPERLLQMADATQPTRCRISTELVSSRATLFYVCI